MNRLLCYCDPRVFWLGRGQSAASLSAWTIHLKEEKAPQQPLLLFILLLEIAGGTESTCPMVLSKAQSPMVGLGGMIPRNQPPRVEYMILMWCDWWWGFRHSMSRLSQVPCKAHGDQSSIHLCLKRAPDP